MDGKIKILIANINKQYAALLCNEIASQDDFEVIDIVDDGNKAYEIAVSKKPNVMLIDMLLQNLDGIGLLEKLNSVHDAHLPNIMVISALYNNDIINEAIALGAKHYVLKPCSMDAIISKIRGLIYEESTYILPLLSISKAERTRKNSLKFDKGMIEQSATDTLLCIGIMPNLKGYTYIRDAIIMFLDNKKNDTRITKYLYPEIAQKYNSTPGSIDRSMNHAIKSLWNSRKYIKINELFGVEVFKENDYPTNARFIATIADNIMVRMARN